MRYSILDEDMQISKSLRPCPYCKKLAAWEGNPWRPFCCERCKMIDLGFWAMGEYRVAGEDISKEIEGGHFPVKDDDLE